MFNDDSFSHDLDGLGPLGLDQAIPDLSSWFIKGFLVAPVNFLFMIFGSLELFYLSRRSTVVPASGLRSWHFLARRITTFLLITLSIIHLGYLLSLDGWDKNPIVLSDVINIVSLIFASCLQRKSYTNSHSASLVLILYWALYAVSSSLEISEWDVVIDPENITLLFLVSLFSAILASIAFVLELTAKPRHEYEFIGEDDHANPEENANIFSRITFYWMSPLMQLGYKKYLTLDDLRDLSTEDHSDIISMKFDSAWKKELSKKSPSLLKTLTFAFGGPFAFAALFKFLQDLLNFVQPQLLKRLMQFVNSQDDVNPQPPSQGYIIAVMMFFTSILQTTFLHQYFQLCFVTGMRVRAGLVTAIYKKALLLSNSSRQHATVGEIVNYMSVDAQKIMDLTTYLHIAWSGPLQIILSLYFLYETMGISAFAGVAVMILMLPVNAVIASKMRTIQKQQMKNKDSRIRLMNEILNGIKVIKLYAWESAFMKKIFHVRNDLELNNLKKLGYLASAQGFTWASTPFLVSFATFAVYVMIADKPLTSEVVFVSLTLFNLLQFPLTIFPNVITSMLEASVSLKRVRDFLKADELDPNSVVKMPYRSGVDPEGTNGKIEMISIEQGSFKWSKDSEPVLDNVDLSVKKGELVAVVGRVGAGKSSLLSSILGEMEKISGKVTTRGHVAYVPQSAWIMNATLRDNITFGFPYEQDFYEEVIEACSLKPDIAILPGGDMTEIGERGINLSGGQKARISLARAVYARADVYLLDDPLSAVDAHVGKHIFDKVLGPTGLLRTKARIFVTHGIHYLSRTSLVLMLDEGRIIEQGNYDTLMKQKRGLYNLIGEHSQEFSEQEEVSSPNTVETYELDEAGIRTEETVRSPRERHLSVHSIHRRSSLKAMSSKEHEMNERDRLIVKEESAKGSVAWPVYQAYIKSCSVPAVAFYFLLMVASQGAQIGANVFLKYWSSKEVTDGVLFYLAIYGCIGLAYSFMSVMQTLVIWVFCAIRAARYLHEEMLKSVVRSPMSFFDTTPLGRILNRFSKDQYTIDEVLPRTFAGYFRTVFVVFATLTVISFSTPLFIIFAIPMLLTYKYIQTYYLSTSRELKRLDSLTRSPIYAHFQETLGGVVTIRAYQQSDRFISENSAKLDVNQKAYYPSVSCNRWLAVRLEFLGSMIIFSASLLSVVTVLTTHQIDAGLVGLSVSYALSVTQALNWAVRQSCEIETNIISVERVKEYIELPSEAPVVIADNRPAPTWPQNGTIDYRNYSTRYRPDLELVLKGISFTVRSKEKIGIVGRTGAGKSSLTLSLFRLIEALDGKIIVDGVDISKIGLYDLRSRLTIIPQDPILFEGTVAFNLDPFQAHDDVEIWQVLQCAHLKNHIAKLEGKLQAKVLEGGENFSHGQRQLLCLARALLRRSPVIVLDEATASVDVETDTKIQETIRTEFNWATLLCIAHRLRTIIDYDRVLVLDQGKIAEFDTPYNLLQNPNSVFYSLCKESNEYEYLFDVASKKFQGRSGKKLTP